MYRPPHFICFAPYTDWSIHSARQVTILQSLRQRGCSVTYVTCDGAFSDCDLLQSATGAPSQKPAHACLFCQARVATRLAGWGMPFRWLGQWLSTQDRAIAAKWVQSINPKNYFEAVFDNWAIGQWVKSSVHRHFRHNVLDLSDHLIASTYGSYLYSGLLACLALNRLFDEEKPDAQLLFNGRMGIPRVALELGKSKGIKTICEERGYVPGRIMLYDNVNCLDFTGFSNLWSAWKETPLSREEIDEIGGLLIDRWHGRTSDITLFSPGMVSGQKLIAALELNPQLQTWALYTSSLDESVDLESERDAFPSQYAWIDATVDFVAAHPEIQLVIRVHPNAGSQKSLGANTQDQDYFQKLTARLPRNVRLIPSDSNHSSYDLAAVSTLGLIWRSTIGVEMAAMGRKVIRLGAGLLTNAEFMTAPSSQSKYIECLDAAAHCAPKPDLGEAIKAWRFAHAFFFRWSMPFPLVSQKNWFVGELAYDSPSALNPGQDPTLDKICAIFMKGEKLIQAPLRRASDHEQSERDEVVKRLSPYQVTPF